MCWQKGLSFIGEVRLSENKKEKQAAKTVFFFDSPIASVSTFVSSHTTARKSTSQKVSHFSTSPNSR